MAEQEAGEATRPPTVTESSSFSEGPEPEAAVRSSEACSRGSNVATRRFLSLCMEDIEPVMEMRGKDAMYQCCYCGKWCTMSGTRALSKHIENEHRPQVIIHLQTILDCLRIKARPGEAKTVYVGFLPLEHWNVNLEATVTCTGAQQWATMLPLHEMKGGADSQRGRPSVHLKMASAKPYLPRPTWKDTEHTRQRVAVRVSESIQDLGDATSSDRAPSGFAVRVETPSHRHAAPLEAEISVSLKIHGKEAAIVFPLFLTVDAPGQDLATSSFHVGSPAAAADAGLAALVQSLKRESSDSGMDVEGAGPDKRPKLTGSVEGPSVAQQLALLQQQAVAQQLAAAQLAAHQQLQSQVQMRGRGPGLPAAAGSNPGRGQVLVSPLLHWQGYLGLPTPASPALNFAPPSSPVPGQALSFAPGHDLSMGSTPGGFGAAATGTMPSLPFQVRQRPGMVQVQHGAALPGPLLPASSAGSAGYSGTISPAPPQVGSPSGQGPETVAGSLNLNAMVYLPTKPHQDDSPAHGWNRHS